MLKTAIKGVMTFAGLVLCTLGIVALVVGLQANKVALAGSERLLEYVLLTDVDIESASIWPPSQSLVLNGVRIMNPPTFQEGPAVTIRTVTVEFDTSRLFADVPHVQTVVLDGVDVTVEHEILGGTNLRRLSENAERFENQAPGATKALRRFIVDRVECTGGTMHVHSDLLLGQSLDMELSPFHLEDLSNDAPVTAADTSRILLRSLVTHGVSATGVLDSVRELLGGAPGNQDGPA